MDIIKYDIYSGPNIGIYSTVNDEFIFLPRGFADGKSEKLSQYLEVKPLEVSVANARVLGVLMAVNNHGILLPSTCSEGEFNHFKENTDLNVEILDVKNNALGNMMSVNNKGGIVSPLIPKEDLQKIQDVAVALLRYNIYIYTYIYILNRIFIYLHMKKYIYSIYIHMFTKN